MTFAGSNQHVLINLPEQSVDSAGSIVIGPIEIELAEGELVVLLGPSGAGKTSLLEAIAGIHSTLAAEVTIEGNFVDRPSRIVQLVFQDDRLPPWIRAGQALEMVSVKRSARDQRVRDLLEIFDLKEKVNAWIATLSGGERSRLSMARGFVDPPRLLLLDEPFRNIDHVLKKKLRAWLSESLESASIATVMVSHNVEDAVALGHRIVLLDQSPMTIWHCEEIREAGSPPLSIEERVDVATQLFNLMERRDHHD